ncbi:type II secretion system F family protein [Thalassoroseus pseudoceratinae]|uniref:type II secretion system F family protein n=1 Tax=Thalassoroseus pseudoceratinae TaxID=2713176 RepID=UPI001420C22E|nr:type II secretion system F family protein [Thalassoroseus pseudoceratinae]
MPDFQYTARELSGKQVSGVLSAGNEQEALGMLASMSLFPVNVQAKQQIVGIGGRVGARQLATFFTQLADLLHSGVPLLRSLELLERQTTKPAFKRVLVDIREQVAEGTRLADAMKKHPKTFGDLAVSMVTAGEEGGFMEDVLKRIASFTEHQEELKSRVVGAMVYPLFLVVLGGGIVAAMLTFFVPKFAPIFERMSDRGGLPWATTALLNTSDAVQSYGLLILLLIAGLIYGLKKWAETPDGRMKVDRFRLNAPGMGPIVRSLAVARFCRILGTLLHNGVPILQSLRIAKDAAGNKVLSHAIGDAAENISAGKSLAVPLRASGEFSTETVEMIAVGEEANNLEQVLIDIAETMERHTNRKLEMFVRLLEPLMLLFMAGLVLFVVAGLMLPILQSSGIF